MTEDIGKLEEKLSGVSLSENVDLLLRRIGLEQAPAFIMGFCASSDERFGQVIDYIADRIQIDKSSIIKFDLKSRAYVAADTHIDYLKSKIDELNALPGDVALVAIDGFEAYPYFEKRNIYNLRGAHDFAQDVVQSQKSRFPGLNKKIVILTHLGDSLGKERHDFALRSIDRSDARYISFKYEVE